MSAPGPMSDADAALEASIRMKTRMGQRLNVEEAEFLARLPSDKDAVVSTRTTDNEDSPPHPR